MTFYRNSWLSPVGTLHLIADDEALLCLAFDQNVGPLLQRLGLPHLVDAENPVLAQARQELQEYFEGVRKCFSVPLAPRGSGFQLRAWQALRGIPYGSRVSYQAQARELGVAGAVRATGTANGRNPIAIIVPCHRVVRSDGTIGGYAGGVELKAKLLELESRAGG